MLSFKHCVCCLFVLCALLAQSQPSSSELLYSTSDTLHIAADPAVLYTIKKIYVEGNRQTKIAIVLRELSFKEGDQLPLNRIVDRFSESKTQLLNSELFHDVVISLKSLQAHDVYVQVSVKERWYIFPLPFFKIADRNFAEWRRNGMSLDRVNYGVDLSHKNFTGRNDQLHIYLMTGFTKQVELSYRSLFFDTAMRWSAGFSVAYGKTREISYQTINSKLVAYQNPDGYVQQFFRANTDVVFRPALKTRHTFSLSYNYLQVDDTVYKLNPAFFNRSAALQYPEFSYRVQYMDVDYYPYPTSGRMAEVWLNKKGFSSEINLAQITAKASRFWPLNHKYFFNLRLLGHLKVPFDQPYMLRRFMPFEGYLQGFEEHVTDGVAGGYAKAVFTREIFSKAYSIPSKKIERLNHIPVRIYAKVFGNAGYVYDDRPGIGTIGNQMLYAAGVGLDVVVFYDWIVKLEWSFNSIGQNGLYLHRRDYY